MTQDEQKRLEFQEELIEHEREKEDYERRKEQYDNELLVGALMDAEKLFDERIVKLKYQQQKGYEREEVVKAMERQKRTVKYHREEIQNKGQ